MRNYTLLGAATILLFFATSCQKDSDPTTAFDAELNQQLEAAINGSTDGKNSLVLPSSADYSAIPQDPLNPLSKAKIDLGKFLYHETGLGIASVKEVGKGTYSCASCHFASAGFQAGRVQGIAEGGIGFGVNGEGRVKGSLYEGDELDVQPLRTPTAMNLAYQKNLLWNGQFGATGVNIGTDYAWEEGTPIATNELGFEGLESQAIAGLGVHRMGVDQDFLDENGYTGMFDAAFPDISSGERYTLKNTGLAIAAYERTILSNEAPFQKWLKGDETAMTSQEKRGAIVFFETANCVSCHNGPSLSKMEFYALGMGDLYDCPEEIFKTTLDDPAHLGRGSFTKKAEDNFKFKVPQLYNLKDSPFYGHGSSFRTIREVVEYKNSAIKQKGTVPNGQLAEEFKPLNLSPNEVNDLVAFLEDALYDPNLKRFEPEVLPSGNCFPFNDPMARNELGCD